MKDDNLPCGLGEFVVPSRATAIFAGRKILDIYEQGFTVEQKSDRSPMTTADMAAHELIVRELRQITPGLPIR